MKDSKILVLGAGSFGTCLAQHLSDKKMDVTIWDIDESVTKEITDRSLNSKYFPTLKINPGIKATSKLENLNLKSFKYIVCAIPTQYTRSVYKVISNKIHDDTIIINASKGIENTTLDLPLDIVKAELSQRHYERACVLSGPSFAIEVMNKQPTAVSVGGRDEETLNNVQRLFHTPYFRAYANNDPIGLEICGALKNVIAIAVGGLAGLGYQQNTKAALITRGLAEIARFGDHLGAKTSTFMSLGGMGDLLLTCGSDKSRNYRIGYYMGQGQSLKEAIVNTGTTAEGVTTAISAYNLALKLDIDAPICKEVYKVLHEEKAIKIAFKDILERKMKSED